MESLTQTCSRHFLAALEAENEVNRSERECVNVDDNVNDVSLDVSDVSRGAY